MPRNRPTPRNDFYSGFLYNKFYDPFTFRLRRLIAGQVEKKDEVVDVGCGTGSLLFHLAPRIQRGVGIDLADRMLDHARRRRHKLGLDNLSFVLADAADLSLYEDKSFDLGLMTLVLHELPPAIRRPALKELIRVSRRQIITDYVVPAGRPVALMTNTIEATAGFGHFHSFRSYVREGGALALIKQAGLRVTSESSALLGMIRIMPCQPDR